MKEKEPEIDLICAVIWQGIKDANSINPPTNSSDAYEFWKYKEQAEKWLISNDTSIMSFCYYCNLIQIDPDWVREVCWKKSEKLFRDITKNRSISEPCEQSVEGVEKTLPKYGYHPRMGT